MTDDKLIRIAAFDDTNLANIARARLEAVGIRAFLENENFVSTDWAMTNASGGVKLLILSNDIDAALELLTLCGNSGDDEGQAIIKQLLFLENPNGCPECGSSEVFREKVTRKWVFLSILLLGLPLPFLSSKKTCGVCEHKWLT